MSKEIMVIRREGKKVIGNPIWLPVGEITMAKAETKSGKAIVVYYTKNGEFINCTGVEQIFGLLESVDGFVVTDRGMIGNFNKDLQLHSEEKTVFFKDVNNFVTVAASKFNVIRKIIEGLLK